MELKLTAGNVASHFILATATGEGSEIACFGPRGEGKTIAALLAIGLHAKLHELAGHPLPVPWIGMTDTFTGHRDRTHESLRKAFWEGAWQLYDDGHKAVFKTNREAVILTLFGIEDTAAIDRARRETCGVWIDEAAPTIEGLGVPEEAWNLAITSQRIPTHAKVAFLTSNYPDEDHWTWRRFMPGAGSKGVHPDDPGRLWFRIPKGDNTWISDKDRLGWRHQLKDRPDLIARLLEGRPGSVQLGAQVAEGFNPDRHVSPTRLKAVKEEPLFVGQDFGHTPATVIGQQWRGFIRVLAALPCSHGGVRQHLRENVKPWLTVNAPWVFKSTTLIQGAYDVSGDTEEESDIDQSPMRVLQEMLAGSWQAGAISWEGRRGPMLEIFNRAVAGEPCLQIDPVDARPLIQSLSGRWYYPQDKNGKISKDLPKKPNHPWEDLGDAFCYLVGRISPQGPKIGYKPTLPPSFMAA